MPLLPQTEFTALKRLSGLPLGLSAKKRGPYDGTTLCGLLILSPCEISQSRNIGVLERPDRRNQLNKVAGIFRWDQREWPQR